MNVVVGCNDVDGPIGIELVSQEAGSVAQRERRSRGNGYIRVEPSAALLLRLI